MKNNKTLWKIDAEYKNFFKKIIRDVLYKYPGIPIEWEDIYYEFLYEIPEVTKGFDEEKGISLSTYYGLQLRYFTGNKCRHYSSNKYKTLNETSLIENDHNMLVCDSTTFVGTSFDLSSLSELEMKVYERNIMNYESLKSISEELNIKYRYVRKAFNSLKRKMLNQIQ